MKHVLSLIHYLNRNFQGNGKKQTSKSIHAMK